MVFPREFSAAFSMALASSRLFASGFSQMTCFPASRAAIAIGMCRFPGVQISMTSMSSRATTSSQFVWNSSQP